MKTIEVIGHIDERHRLLADVPADIPPGPIRLKIEIPADDDEVLAEHAWQDGVIREWAPEWSDPREDIYTLEDGEPVDGADGTK